MRKPYENIYLGNFILTIGYLAGKNNVPLNRTAIELLQQTPYDKVVGDLFANWGGKNLLFEFKRSEELVLTEYLKPTRKNLIEIINTPKYSEYLQLANSCHYLCYCPSKITNTLYFLQYSKIQNNKTQDINSGFELNVFCEKLLESPLQLGLNYNDFIRYLKLIHACMNSKTNVGSEGGIGIIMNISENGTFNIIEYDNILSLSLSLDIEQQPTITKAIDRGRGR